MDDTVAVVTAAGLGTRMRPATLVLPKEMFPLGDRPVLHHVVAEAAAAGLRQVILVVGGHGEMIERYFATVRRQAPELADVEIEYVYAPEPKGVGWSVLAAREAVSGRVAAVLLGDNVLPSPALLARLLAVHAETNGSVVAATEVPDEDVGRHGCLEPVERNGDVVRLHGLVEKPLAGSAPSNLGVIGRYVLKPDIFDHLAVARPGLNNEIQLTDALSSLARTGALCGVVTEIPHFDVGDPEGFVITALAFGLGRFDVAAWLKSWLSTYRADGAASPPGG